MRMGCKGICYETAVQFLSGFVQGCHINATMAVVVLTCMAAAAGTWWCWVESTPAAPSHHQLKLWTLPAPLKLGQRGQT
jgi:hypothetical protein